MRRQRLLDEIADTLTLLASKVRLLNSVNLTDLSVHAEDFYCDLLNSIYGYALKNLNTESKSAEAIDLGDIGRRVAVQVTADGSTAKLRTTVTTFISRELYKKFDRLIVLQIAGEANHREGQFGETDVFLLDRQDDVWDNRKLIADIKGLSTIQIEAIHRMLQSAGFGPRRRPKALAVGAIILVLVLLGFCAYVTWSAIDRASDNRMIADLEEKQATLRAAATETQRELQDKLNKGHALVAYVDVSANWADMIARESSEIQPLADKLRKVADDFEKAFEGGVLAPDDERLIRISRATIANAEGRYSDANSLITKTDIEQSTNDLAKMLLAKSDALFGLRQWTEALSHYKRANDLVSSNSAQIGMANSLYYLGRYDEADLLWVEVLKQLDAEFQHGDSRKGRAAAVGMANYAGVLLERGKFQESLQYAFTALTLFRLLRPAEQDELTRRAMDLDIARIHARLGHIFEALGQYSVAEQKLESALNVYRTLTFGEYPTEYLAETFDDLGIVHFRQGRTETAAENIRVACTIYESAVKDGRTALVHDWAVCLHHLARTQVDSNPEEAIVSITQAIRLCEPLTTDSVRQDELANMLMLRGVSQSKLKRDDAAAADLSRAESLASPQLKKSVREQLNQSMMKSSSNAPESK